MELVDLSVGGSGLGLAGLGTCQGAKNKRVNTVYFCGASYKKPKKPAAGDLVESSTGSLHLGDLDGDDSKPAASWRSKVGSVSGSVSGLLDVENLGNLVAEETSYVDLALTPSKFPGVICSTFTSESSLIKARKMAVYEKIVVNDNLRKANICLNQEVIVKKIPVDLPKLAVELVFFKFGKIISIRMQLIGLWQKALIEFESSEVAGLVTSK
ncbi:hypothetical protein G9A89_001981 [Geosiphon pyriformis]|nr:hypothetical protein G9A89_001981 [Geosiphon pyriformis]